jgi:poly(A) polymerase Pap1
MSKVGLTILVALGLLAVFLIINVVIDYVIVKICKRIMLKSKSDNNIGFCGGIPWNLLPLITISQLLYPITLYMLLPKFGIIKKTNQWISALLLMPLFSKILVFLIPPTSRKNDEARKLVESKILVPIY